MSGGTYATNQNGVKLPYEILTKKIADYQRTKEEFLVLLNERRSFLNTNYDLHTAFIHEMRRFLPANVVSESVEDVRFWAYVTEIVNSECQAIDIYLSNKESTAKFIM